MNETINEKLTTPKPPKTRKHTMFTTFNYPLNSPKQPHKIRKHKIRRAGAAVLAVAALLVASIFVVGAVTNNASADDGDPTATRPAGIRTGDVFSLTGGGKRNGSMFSFDKLDDGSTASTCFNTAANDVLGVNTLSPDLELVITATKNDTTSVLSDGSRSLTLTEELKEEFAAALKSCYETNEDSIKGELMAQFQEKFEELCESGIRDCDRGLLEKRGRHFNKDFNQDRDSDQVVDSDHSET